MGSGGASSSSRASTPAAVPVVAAASAYPAEPAKEESAAKEYLQLWVGLGILYVVDYFMKGAFLSAGIKFPSSLVGMFAITGLLIVMGEKAAAQVRGFFAPALNWIAKWLPLFYVASLVTLPLALKGLSGDELAKIMGILSFGMVGTLLFTASTTVFIRNLVKTPNKEVSKAKPASPYLPSHYLAWGAAAVAALLSTLVSPTGLGPQMALPFCLACTVGGYLLGNAVPGKYHGYLHPVVVTALVANAGAALYGNVIGVDYDTALKIYYSKGAGPMGAGDFLMSFLGSVIMSMGFRIYDQRETMKRHAPEILGATLLSSIFSFFSTALVAKALGLQAGLARALIPRSVTVALALPIANQLDAPLSITAAAVLLQGLLGANFGPGLMSAVGIKDTIARGLAAAGTAGGLGTASLTSKEPEALPFCALSYSMVGILSTFLAATPFVRNMLISIVG